MAVQGTQDLKIFSSVRPLQIQRSFEGPPEATDIVEAVTRDVTIEKRSSVTITSQTSLTGMSTVHSTVDGVPASPLPASGSVIIRSASSTTSTSSPGTVFIRSSGAGSTTSPGVGSQNVVILRSPLAVAQTGPAAPQPQLTTTGQGGIVIRSAAASPPATPTAIQPNAQSRILISPAPIAQSRITITGGGGSTTPVPQTTTPPLAVETEILQNETPTANSVPAPSQGRRSSLTIKTAPSPPSPTPVTVTPPVHSIPASIQPLSSAVNGVPTSSDVPLVSAVTEHRSPELTTDHSTSTAAHTVTAKEEDLSEKIHQKKPAGPSLEELLGRFDIAKVFYTALAVLITGVACILTEGEVPLSWLLAAISVISLGCFIALRL